MHIENPLNKIKKAEQEYVENPFHKTEHASNSTHVAHHDGPVIGRKVVLAGHGGVEVLNVVDFEYPLPGKHEVRIRVEAIGLNYIETYFRKGIYPLQFPSGLGSEGAGIVESVGPEVTSLKVGDRVGYCTGPTGAYGDYYLAPESKVVKLPHHISFEVAAASMLKGLTAHYLVKQLKELRENDVVVFWAAAGGVGLIAVQWLKMLGVKTIAITSGGAKAEVALKAGAWKVLDHKTEDVVARVAEITNGRKAKVVFDSIGAATWNQSLDMVEPRGLLVSYGNASGPVTDVNLGILSAKGSLFVTRPTLFAYADNHRSLSEMATEMFSLVERGYLKVQINQRYALSNIAQAHLDIESGATVGSTVIYPDDLAKKFFNL